MKFPNFREENKLKKKGFKLICGIDEAGYGAWAGPLVIGAVILSPFFKKISLCDSKKLSPKKREIYFKMIKQKAVTWSTGRVSQKAIDKHGIIWAKKKALALALAKISQKPDFLLIDGPKFFTPNLPHKFVVSGDNKVKSIAAASIVAKVIRDKIMTELHKKYPKYHFDKNKGYGTANHQKALKKYGPCQIHRISYKPFKAISHFR